MRCSVILTANFNPRSHKGSDEDFIDLAERLVISIHAPTRGATPIISVSKCEDVISIHAPTRGATRPKGIAERAKLFQSTLPQGERRWGLPFISPMYTDFNPRSHKGSDGITASMMYRGCGFQSTLPQGERQQFYTKFHICFISFLPILSPYHISTHSPLPTFNHFLYIFSGANRPEISCLLPFRTKTISGIL